MRVSVGWAKKGSTKAVSGSGMTIMSDSWMDFHPLIEEPSNPRPSGNTLSLN